MEIGIELGYIQINLNIIKELRKDVYKNFNIGRLVIVMKLLLVEFVIVVKFYYQINDIRIYGGFNQELEFCRLQVFGIICVVIQYIVLDF